MRICGWGEAPGVLSGSWWQKAWVLPVVGEGRVLQLWLKEEVGRLDSRCWGLRAAHGSHRSTPYSAYDPETYSGHWKQLTVRTSRRSQAMAIAYFHPQVSV